MGGKKINKFSGPFLVAIGNGGVGGGNQQIQQALSGSHWKWGEKSTDSAGIFWKPLEIGRVRGSTNSAMFLLCRIRGYLASGPLNRDPTQS